MFVEGASDVHVLAHCGFAALGIPGTETFKPEMASSLLPFAELVLIQEPDKAGEGLVSTIVKELKAATDGGTVKAVSLPDKDPRGFMAQGKRSGAIHRRSRTGD